MLAWRFGNRAELLEVVWKDERRHRSLGQSDPGGPVDEVPDLSGVRGHLHVLVGYGFEEVREVHLLIVGAAQSGTRLLTDDGEDRLVVLVGVVEAIEEVYRPGARGRQAYAELAR